MIHESLIYRNKFGSAPMRALWSEPAMVQRWLDFEAAIALSQGELGIMPMATAQRIAAACTIERVTPQAVAAWNDRTGHVIVSLVKAFRDAEPEAGELFHYGPTTQDVLDTGLVLCIRDSLELLVPALTRLQQTLSEQALRYRHTVMAGRTEGQLAVPITFGHKLAVLATELSDHLMRLAQCGERLLWLTLFGATGVQSSFCQIADIPTTQRLLERVGARLGLRVPVICLHHRTDRYAELGCVLANLLSTLGEAGLEIRDLQRSELAEVSEPWSDAQHSSSTMPQKQNPETSEWLEGLAKLARGYAVSLLDMQQQHERDISRLAPQLHALPNLFLMAMSAVESAERIYRGLQVHETRMAENVVRNGGAIMAEALMLALAKRSGRKVWAHQRIHDLAMRAAARGGNLAEIVAADAEVAQYMTRAQVEALCVPANYTGTAAVQVDAAEALCRAQECTAQEVFERVVFNPAAAERAARGRPQARTGREHNDNG